MKKSFLIAGALFALCFTSCKKDNPVDNLQIDGIEVPLTDVGNPVLAGSSVTVKGSGFTEASEIWFRVATKSSSDVQATVTAVTKTEITFTVPDVVGSQSIILKQDGQEKVLGEMSFAKEEVYAIISDEQVVGQALNKYDPKTGEFVEQDGDYTNLHTYMIDDGSVKGIIALNNNLYYIGYLFNDTSDYRWGDGVVKYDLETNQVSFIKDNTKNRIFVSVVLVNNKLYAVVFDKAKGYELFEISDNGTETLVNSFGDIEFPFDDTNSYNWLYDKTTNSIFCQLDYEPAQYQGYVVSFSLESGKITLSDVLGSDISDLFLVGSKLHFKNYDYNDAQETTSTFYEIDPVTLQKGDAVKVVSGNVFIDDYSESLNKIFYNKYFDRESNPEQNFSYDISTETVKELDFSMYPEDYVDVIIMRITK